MLIHPDPTLREGLRSHLERAGLQAVAQGSWSDRDDADLVVLRWPEPRFSRLGNARTLALVESATHIESAFAACDDVVRLPCDALEFQLRASRLAGKAPLGEGAATLEIAGIKLNSAAQRVWVDDAEVMLTRREYHLLEYLMRHAGHVLDKATLLRHAWGEDFPGKMRTVDQHILQLRTLMGEDARNPRRIVTLHGRGYMFLADAP